MTLPLPIFVVGPVEVGPDPNVTTPLNPVWWATAATAHAIARNYHGKAVALPPYWPAPEWREAFRPAAMWYCKFQSAIPATDGPVFINAGLLADCYVRNPDAPEVADKEVRDLIESSGGKI